MTKGMGVCKAKTFEVTRNREGPKRLNMMYGYKKIMHSDIAANVAKLLELGEKLKEDDKLRLQINEDPLGFLKSLGIEVDDEFSDSVVRGLKSITVGKGAPPDLPPDLQASVEKVSASIAVEEDLKDYEFRVNGWGLVLVVPESKINQILTGETVLAGLLGELGIALAAAAVAVPALLPLCAAGATFCPIVAAWIFAEIVAIAWIDSTYHKGVYLTWTWLAIAVTWYVPVPTQIT